MPVYNKREILLLPKVIVLNPKDGDIMAAVYKGLFILAEDWEPEKILPAIEEMDAAEITVKELL